jgi:hypothetical protein
MREYSNYNAPSNMLIILSREEGERPHTSPWITQAACVNSRPICEVPSVVAATLGDDSGQIRIALSRPHTPRAPMRETRKLLRNARS